MPDTNATPCSPLPHPDAVVVAGPVRFTVLTSRLVRMEWAGDGRFEDRASLVFLRRTLTPPPFRVTRSEDGLRLDTGDLRIRYSGAGARFAEGNLEVRVATGGVETVWRPGTAAEGNLGGTIATVDELEGPVPLGEGVLSRDGWALLDDTDRPLLEGDDLPWAVARPPGERQDWYFFGYGRDYVAALGDYARVAGPIPLPPRFAFGFWWSRYWAHTDAELMALTDDFRRFQVPLDVLVLDMDWHETFELRWDRGPRDASGLRKGWTGYTWNRTYFPDPEAFLAWAHARGLKVPLNLHPAGGVQPWEECYPALAEALGIEDGAWIPFRLEDRRFAEAFLHHVIRPLERQGVDFWWLDWQQWNETTIEGLNPIMWLNHVFFTEMERSGHARPIILHRYGGPGAHRYQVGFSGDAASTWDVLAFEPEMTATAANVLYAYWSHDIGGHLPGKVTPELYTRWIQFGAFSPVCRTHATRNPEAERRIWAYPPRHFRAMREALRLRASLVPYLYTAAREAYDTGVAPLRPMYYAHPDAEEAYSHPGQYMFGPDLLVSPVTAPADEASGLAARATWMPPGAWIEWSTGTLLRGPEEVVRAYALDEVPVFARAGALLPMAPASVPAGTLPDPLVVTVFPGAPGSARLYEDAGDDRGYIRGVYSVTRLEAAWEGAGCTIVVRGAEGDYPGMPQARALDVRLAGVWPPVSVEVDGTPVTREGAGANGGAATWAYRADRLELRVRLPRADVRRERIVRIAFRTADRALLDGVPGALRMIRQAVRALEHLWPDDWAPESLIGLMQTPRRIDLRPEDARPEIERLRRALPSEVARARALRGKRSMRRRAVALLEEATSRLSSG